MHDLHSESTRAVTQPDKLKNEYWNEIDKNLENNYYNIVNHQLHIFQQDLTH